MKKKELEILIDKGFSQHKIANEVNISQAQISRLCNKYGLKTTSRPGPPPEIFNYCKQCNKRLHNRKSTFCSIKCRQNYNISQWKIDSNTACDRNGNIKSFVRSYLIKNRGEKCEECGWDKRNPVTGNVPLDLHHIKFCTDHSESNLQLLCPNCHSLTSNYKSLNKGNGRHIRMKRYKDGKSY